MKLALQSLEERRGQDDCMKITERSAHRHGRRCSNVSAKQQSLKSNLRLSSSSQWLKRVRWQMVIKEPLALATRPGDESDAGSHNVVHHQNPALDG